MRPFLEGIFVFKTEVVVVKMGKDSMRESYQHRKCMCAI